MGGGGGGVGEADIAIFKLGSGGGGGCTDATFGDRPGCADDGNDSSV